MTKEDLEKYHNFINNYQILILNTQLCGCFYCCQFFLSDSIKEFVHNNTCALCPLCGIDSVIPLTCYPDMNKEFLDEMYNYWFERSEIISTENGNLVMAAHALAKGEF